MSGRDDRLDSNVGNESDSLLPSNPPTTYGILRDINLESTITEEENRMTDGLGGRLVPYAPDGGYGWVIVAVAFLSNLVLDGVSLCPGVLQNVIQIASGIRNSSSVTTDYKENHVEYNISVGMYTLIGSILVTMQFLLGPIVALLITKIGIRGVGVMGPVLSSIGIFLSWASCPVVPNIWILIIFYGLVTGFGFGMMYQVSMVMVGTYFSKNRSLAIGIAICGTGVGSIVFPNLVDYMIEIQGWQGAFLLQAGIVLFSTTFAFFYRPLPMKWQTLSSGEMEDYSSNEDNHSPVSMAVTKPMGSLWKSPTFVLLAISSAIAALGFFGPYAFVPGMSVTGFHMSMKSSVFAVTCIGISNTIGRLFCGYIADQNCVNQLMLNNIAMTVCGLVTILLPFLTQEYQMYIYVIIFGFCIGIFAVLRSVLVITFLGVENFNNAFGMVLMCMGITTLIGNPIGGWLKDTTGDYKWSFYAAGSYFVIAASLCYPLQCISDWENKNKNSKYTAENA